MGRFLSIICALLVLGSIGGSVASAQDNLASDNVTDSSAVETARAWRRYAVTRFPGTILLRGARVQKTGSTFRADAVAFSATVNQKVAFGASYWNFEGDVTGTRQALESFDLSGARFAAGVRILKLLEYNETNGVDGYQPNEDQVLSTFDLDSGIINNIWRDAVLGARIVVRSDGTNTTVRMARLCTKGFVFCVNLYVADRPVYINGRLNSADTLKVTLELDYWNINNTLASKHVGAKLAVIMAVGSSAKRGYATGTRTEPTGPVDGVDIVETEDVGGGFNWERNVEVTNNTDGNKRMGAVHVQFDGSYNDATVAGGWDTTWTISRVIYSFGLDNPIHQSKILWDPDMAIAVNYDAVDSGDASGLAQPLVAFLAVVVALLALIM